MSGSAQVNANLTIWEKTALAGCKAEMSRHINQSKAYAKTNKPWEDQSGGATAGIKCKTEANQSQIVSTLYGDNQTNYHLENPNDNVRPYGNPNATPFGSRFRIIEAARSNNIGQLWSNIRKILAGGGYGISFGGGG